MDNDFYTKRQLLNEAFTPSAPVDKKDFFQGRVAEIRLLIDSFWEHGQHSIIFGERGVGKSSLSNVIPDFLQGTSIPVIKVSCNRNDNFKSIWSKALSKIPIEISSPLIGFNASDKKEVIRLANYLPNNPTLNPSDISTLLQYFKNLALFIFDEFDTIKDAKTKERFADLIKDLSDSRSQVKILIVGIGNNVLELIGQHKSIERCLKQIRLKRLEPLSIKDISNTGFKHIGLTYSSDIVDKIALLSTGFGHYAHLLSKYAAKAALDSGSLNISTEHFNKGLFDSIENATESIKESYRLATVTTEKENKFKQVLHACALADTDDHNTFGTKDILAAFNVLTNRNENQQAIAYNIGKLASDERGNVLEKVESGRYNRYRFSNPLLKVYIRLILFQSGEFN